MNRNLSVINACITFLQNLWLPQYYYTYLGFSNRSLIDYLNALKFILLFCILQKERSRKINLNLQQPKQVIPVHVRPIKLIFIFIYRQSPIFILSNVMN